MAIDAPTTLSDFDGFLNPNQAQAYFEATRRRSVVQQLARQVPLGINGEAIPVTTGKPTASWVSEGGQKPVNEGARTLADDCVTRATIRLAVFGPSADPLRELARYITSRRN